MLRYTVLQETIEYLSGIDTIENFHKFTLMDLIHEKKTQPFTNLNFICAKNIPIELPTNDNERIVNQVPIDDLMTLASFTLEDAFKDLIHHIEIDIYHIINFTCEYVLNADQSLFLEYDMNPIQTWFDMNDEVICNDRDSNLMSSFLTNEPKLKLPFNEQIKIESKKITALKLCSPFSLYIYKNILTSVWYNPNKNNNYDKFLISNLSAAESCQFKEEDFYLFEILTNVNSCYVLCKELNRILPKGIDWEAFMHGENIDKHSNLKNYIDNLIYSVALTPLVFSKSIILENLFDKAKRIFKWEATPENVILYITEQLKLIQELLKKTSIGESIGASKRLLNYYKKVYGNTTNKQSLQSIMLAIKKENKAQFYERYSCEDEGIQLNKIIIFKPKDAKTDAEKTDAQEDEKFKTIKKTNQKKGYINAYIQKRLVECIYKDINPSETSTFHFVSASTEELVIKISSNTISQKNI